MIRKIIIHKHSFKKTFKNHILKYIPGAWENRPPTAKIATCSNKSIVLKKNNITYLGIPPKNEMPHSNCFAHGTYVFKDCQLLLAIITL